MNTSDKPTTTPPTVEPPADQYRERIKAAILNHTHRQGVKGKAVRS